MIKIPNQLYKIRALTRQKYSETSKNQNRKRPNRTNEDQKQKLEKH